MKKSGFTLIEVMIAMVVFVITVLAMLGVYLSVSISRESSRNMTQAMSDARVALEAMRDTSTAGLPAVTATYPQGTNLASTFGLTSLNSESVTPTYVNQAADPLNVTVTVNWTDRGRARTASVNTLLTHR